MIMIATGIFLCATTCSQDELLVLQLLARAKYHRRAYAANLFHSDAHDLHGRVTRVKVHACIWVQQRIVFGMCNLYVRLLLPDAQQEANCVGHTSSPAVHAATPHRQICSVLQQVARAAQDWQKDVTGAGRTILDCTSGRSTLLCCYAPLSCLSVG